MDFSHALVAVKAGAKISRSGWNGAGMYVVHQKGYPDGIEINKNTAEATGGVLGAICVFRPYLMMCTVDESFVPWVASQTDLLAEDWVWTQLKDEVPQWADVKGLRESARKLIALENAGVDNWEGYSHALRDFDDE